MTITIPQEPEESFISKELISADLKMIPILEKNRARLDNISKDLKLLEQRLKTYAIPTNLRFIYQKKHNITILSQQDFGVYDGNILQVGHLEYKFYVLSWEKDTHQNSRILHYHFSNLFNIYSKSYKPSEPNEFWIKEVNYSQYEFDNDIQDLKPLAECTSAIRIQVFPYLNEFYLNIKSFLENDILSDTYSTESETIKNQPSIKELIFQKAVEMNYAVLPKNSRFSQSSNTAFCDEEIPF